MRVAKLHDLSLFIVFCDILWYFYAFLEGSISHYLLTTFHYFQLIVFRELPGSLFSSFVANGKVEIQSETTVKKLSFLTGHQKTACCEIGLFFFLCSEHTMPSSYFRLPLFLHSKIFRPLSPVLCPFFSLFSLSFSLLFFPLANFVAISRGYCGRERHRRMRTRHDQKYKDKCTVHTSYLKQ